MLSTGRARTLAIILAVLVTLAPCLLSVTASYVFNNCTGEKLLECGPMQECNTAKRVCECVDGYYENPDPRSVNDLCVDKSHLPTPPPNAAGRSWTMAFLSLFTIAILVAAVGLIVQKYDLISWIRRKIEARRSTSVMYEDVMIGQDDPPISA